jgi:predicted nucleotidyltransferase
VPAGQEAARSPATVCPDLNELLAELVARVEALLGDNFVGAYLIGSFALGGGDLQSDCDFLVVTLRQGHGRNRPWEHD